MRNFQKS
jgi:CCR4-NOT transcription complex subunit 1